MMNKEYFLEIEEEAIVYVSFRTEKERL